jgi:hypothetical protein
MTPSHALKTPAPAGISAPPPHTPREAPLYTVRRPPRVSQYISVSQAENLRQATFFADNELKLRLSQHLTIRWPKNAWSPQKRRRLFELLRKWVNRAGVPFTAIWVVETGRLSEDVNPHAHMLVHLPDNLAEACAEFVRERMETDTPDVKIGPVNDYGLLRYVLKGVDPTGYERFAVRKEHQDAEGPVAGLRCGTSRNIGRAEREAYFVAKTVSSQRPVTTEPETVSDHSYAELSGV